MYPGRRSELNFGRGRSCRNDRGQNGGTVCTPSSVTFGLEGHHRLSFHLSIRYFTSLGYFYTFPFVPIFIFSSFHFSIVVLIDVSILSCSSFVHISCSLMLSLLIFSLMISSFVFIHSYFH